VPFGVESRWFTGACEITTYDLDELLGTKLRALYQWRKGRDLFDIATALSMGDVDPRRLMAVFLRYMNEGGHRISRAEFEENLALKMEDSRFLTDIPPLLAAGRQWNSADAAERVHQTLFPLMEG
jgi:predicted nucleotidyltransferase component of viral defense system